MKRYLGIAILLVPTAMVASAEVELSEVHVEGEPDRLRSPLEVVETGYGHMVAAPIRWGDSLLRQCSRETPGTASQYFAPSSAELTQAGSILALHFLNNPVPKELREQYRGWPNLATSLVQAIGVVRPEGRRIYLSYIPGPATDSDWRHEDYAVCDTPPDFFGAEIDLAARSVVHLAFNTSPVTVVSPNKSLQRAGDP